VIPVSLAVADPALAQRLTAALPVTDPAEALALVTDDAEADSAEGLPRLVFVEHAAALAALRAGAAAVLPPDAPVADIALALEAIRRGYTLLPPALRPALLRPAAEPLGPLTPRERQVLALLADGASNKVIARRLGVSFATAKSHVASVLEKTGSASRAEAVAKAFRDGALML
jgi:DNA-binding NarL/FixJ family response regulator